MTKLGVGLRALAGIGSAALLSSAATAEDGVSADSGGITLEAADGDVELTLGGRVHLDALSYHEGADDLQEVDFRRARLELSGRIGRTIRFRIDREFAQSGGWRNLWLGVRPTRNFELRGGNVIVPFSMEEMQSSNRYQLMERSLVTALAPGYSLGGFAQFSQRNWTASAGYFGDALDTEEGRSEERGKGFAGRVTVAPINTRRRFLHLAASIEQRSLDADESLRFQANAGSNLGPDLLSTGRILDVDKLRNLGGEAAFSSGPFLLQAQFVTSNIDRALGPSLNFDAWYAQASFVVTGEDYGYSRRAGTVMGVDLRRKRGAVELAARISQLDLNDGVFQRGNGQRLTVGANWYVNPNLRLMLNYARSSLDDPALKESRTADLIAGRFQINF